MERTAPEIESIIIAPPSADAEFDVAACFDRLAATELEIGSGKGGFLLGAARAHPERNYVGIEWANKYFRYAADRMARWGVSNVRLMRTDARHLVIRQLPPDVLAAIHIYHPDPWPKKRHHKRRLFIPAFVQAVGRVLQSGGRLFVQTDHAEYIDLIAGLVAREPTLSVLSESSEESAGPETNFEIKYRRAGRTIYRLTAVRRAGSVSPESGRG